MRRPSPLDIRLVLAAAAIAAAAGLLDWALVQPDEPFAAWSGVVIAGGSATAFILPLLLP